jgi:DNA-binding response OmpR family regulator
MNPLNVVIVQSDSSLAAPLADSFRQHFRAVHTVPSLSELRAAVLKHRAQVVVLDVELAGLSQVEQLRREFKNLCIVCTHRLADEDMWSEVMSAGATDICCSSDISGILSATLRHTPAVQVAAA